jgi:aspartyl protease family protein
LRYDGGLRRNVLSDSRSRVRSWRRLAEIPSPFPFSRSERQLWSHNHWECALGPWIALILLVGGAFYLLLSNNADAFTGLSQEQIVQVVACVSILIFIGGGVLSSYRGRRVVAAKHALDWALFFLLLIAVYTYRSELLTFANRVAGELAPPGFQLGAPEEAGGNRTAKIRRQWNSHFVAPAKINGKTIEMMIDTGASTVVLRTEDAKRAGIDVSRLTYSVPVQTANGQSYAASIRINNISIGSVSLNRVDALVAKPGALQTSLLGMSFLSRLRSYEFSGNYLTLRS